MDQSPKNMHRAKTLLSLQGGGVAISRGQVTFTGCNIYNNVAAPETPNDVHCEHVNPICVYPMSNLNLGHTTGTCECVGRDLPLGEACTRGENVQCSSSLVCGRYNRDDKAFQCCNCNDCVEGGVFWCKNDEGEACNEGVNENCRGAHGGLVCGRYNDDGNAFQCCHLREDNNDAIAWCSTPSPPALPPLEPASWADLCDQVANMTNLRTEYDTWCRHCAGNEAECNEAECESSYVTRPETSDLWLGDDTVQMCLYVDGSCTATGSVPFRCAPTRR